MEKVNWEVAYTLSGKGMCLHPCTIRDIRVGMYNRGTRNRKLTQPYTAV